MGPFDFWAAGTDNGVPRDTHWRVRPAMLALAALITLVIVVAVFIR